MSFRSGAAAEEPAVRRQRQEIILGVHALRAGLISEPMFVALVVMALFTSLISGPAIQTVMGRRVTHA